MRHQAWPTAGVRSTRHSMNVMRRRGALAAPCLAQELWLAVLSAQVETGHSYALQRRVQW